MEVETLKIERMNYQREAQAERIKNRELEDEFALLRSLIADTAKPVGWEENQMVKIEN